MFTWDDLNDCFMACYNGSMARCSSNVCYGPHCQNLNHSQPEGEGPGRGGWISVDGGDPVSGSAGLRPGRFQNYSECLHLLSQEVTESSAVLCSPLEGSH